MLHSSQRCCRMPALPCLSSSPGNHPRNTSPFFHHALMDHPRRCLFLNKLPQCIVLHRRYLWWHCPHPIRQKPKYAGSYLTAYKLPKQPRQILSPAWMLCPQLLHCWTPLERAVCQLPHSIAHVQNLTIWSIALEGRPVHFVSCII
jgi:hypothetical protein